MIISIHHVTQAGKIELVSANVPFSNLQWTRRCASVGEFSVALIGRFPAPWPGRYLLTRDDAREVGVVEKVEAGESAKGEASQITGRFLESIWSRYEFGKAGEDAVGANWRQSVTTGMVGWHLSDVPPLVLGKGTELATGNSDRTHGKEGATAEDAIYSRLQANGAYPLVTYDRDADRDHLVIEILTGEDRTRSQRKNPLQLFSLMMGNVSGANYSGDYSAAASTILAYAEKGSGEETVRRSLSYAVPSFDPATQWLATAYEDVSQLVGDAATVEQVRSAAALRAYDHLPSIAIDGTVSGVGYKTDWDLGDLCEVEMPSIGLTAAERVQEVREVAKAGGVTVEATLGTKSISRLARAMMGRR